MIGASSRAPGPAAPDPGDLVDGSAVEPSLRRDPIAWAIVFLGVFIACYSAWWASGLGDATVSSRITGAGTAPGAVIVILIALRLRRTSRMDERTRRAWSIITGALVCYSFGALLHFRMGTSPVLGIWPIGMALEIAAYPLAALGLLP